MCFIFVRFLISPLFRILHNFSKEIELLGQLAVMFIMLLTTQSLGISMELGCFLGGFVIASVNSTSHRMNSETMVRTPLTSMLLGTKPSLYIIALTIIPTRPVQWVCFYQNFVYKTYFRQKILIKSYHHYGIFFPLYFLQQLDFMYFQHLFLSNLQYCFGWLLLLLRLNSPLGL